MKAAILNALAGSTGQNPVSLDVLARLGKKADVADAITTLLEGRPPAINTARVMRSGVWNDLYWLTGGVEKFNMHNYKINTPKEVAPTPAEKVCTEAAHMKLQPKLDKEIIMNESTTPLIGGSRPSEVNKTIYDKILVHPGISLLELIKHALHKFPNSTEKKVRKTIDNMIRVTKKIRSEGVKNDRTLHLNTNKAPVAPPRLPAAKPVAYGKVITGPEAEMLRGNPQFASSPVKEQEVKTPPQPATPVVDNPAPAVLTARTKSQTVADNDFSLMLSDDDSLFINIGDEVFRLDPQQLARLDRFMARVFPDGVRAL